MPERGDTRGKPIAGFNNPVVAFQKLLSAKDSPLENLQAMLADKRSVLDAVRKDAKRGERGLNTAERAKLDVYFKRIRDIEARLSKEQRWLGQAKPEAPLPAIGAGLVGRGAVLLMYDLIVAPVQADSTWVMTFRSRSVLKPH